MDVTIGFASLTRYIHKKHWELNRLPVWGIHRGYPQQKPQQDKISIKSDTMNHL